MLQMSGVGERIKKRRQELDWTQDHLAQKAGISKSFLSDLENGKRSVSANNLLDIARVLAVSLDYLMTGEASKEPEAEVPIPASLARFAAGEGLSFRRCIRCLLHGVQVEFAGIIQACVGCSSDKQVGVGNVSRTFQSAPAIAGTVA